MSWEPVDLPGSSPCVHAPLVFREADNAVERWTKRLSQQSICFDYRDPVDVASVTGDLEYIFPEIRILPGCDSLKLRLRNRVTNVSGVDITWSAQGMNSSSAVTSLTTITDNNEDVTLDISEWIADHDIDNDMMVLTMRVASIATSDALITIAITGGYEGIVTTGGFGGVTDPLDCFALQFYSTIKTVALTPGQMPDGPVQIVYNQVLTATDVGWYSWPQVRMSPNIPATAGYFIAYGEEYDKIQLQRYARLQFWSLGIEQLATSEVPVLGRSTHKPIITDGVQTKASLRPDYPARAVLQRPLYMEGERMYEVHTSAHSQGPYMGSGGQDNPGSTAQTRGTWAGYPAADWSDIDTSTKSLFGCRVGDDPEFRTPGSATTKTRRAMTVDVSLLFIGGTWGVHQFDIDARTYTAGSPTVIYESPTVPIAVQGGLRPLNSGSGVMSPIRWSMVFPGSLDVVTAPGTANKQRRCNIQGLWSSADLAQNLIRVSFTVFDPDPANADPEVLRVRCVPQLTLANQVVGDHLDHTGSIRCFVVGWSVTSQQGGQPDSVGV